MAASGSASATDSASRAELVTPSLDGSWFRRERERIAIGRRTVAAALRVAESRVAALETRKLPVPSEWLDAVAGLGFRIPSGSTIIVIGGGTASAECERIASDGSSPALQPAEDLAMTRAEPAGADTLHVPDTDAALDPLEKRNSEPQQPAVSKSAPAPAAETQATPASEPLRGRWLRTRRYALQLSLRTASTALQTSMHDLSIFESNNLVVPPLWIPILEALNFYDAVTQTRAMQQSQASYLNGSWLREQRRKQGYSSLKLSELVHVRSSVLALIEARNWPLLPEWLPALAMLGLPVPKGLLPRQQDSALDVAAQSLGTPTKKKGPQGQPSAVLTSAPASLPASLQLSGTLKGGWLRKERERLRLSQKAVGQHLDVKQTTLCKTERQDRLIPGSWLPVLQRLGFFAGSSKPESSPTDGLTGAWLKQHRQRLERTIAYISDRTRIAWKLIQDVEKRNEPIPQEWLPGLQKLGFSVPSHLLKPAEQRQTGAKAAKPELPCTDTAKATAQPAPRAGANPASSADVIELIIDYRTRIGKTLGLSPLQLLSSIVKDLQEAEVKQRMTYEDVKAAVRGLLLPDAKPAPAASVQAPASANSAKSDKELRHCERKGCKNVFAVKSGGRTALRRFCSSACRDRSGKARARK